MSKTTAEKGKFKIEINNALYKNQDIVELLLGDKSIKNKNELIKEFKNHVKSHLFIDDTITEESTFIFYDVTFPSLRPNTKMCNIVMYLISHRNILENFSKSGYFGDRIDILSQMVENTLINDPNTSKSFGIGELSLDSIDIYNSSKFYGCIMTFSVPNFR